MIPVIIRETIILIGGSAMSWEQMTLEEEMHFAGALTQKQPSDFYRIESDHDDRCGVCREMAGKIFLRSEAVPKVNYPPFHPNCRCRAVTLSGRMAIADVDWMRQLHFGRQQERKREARKRLNEILDRQYPLWRTPSTQEMAKMVDDGDLNSYEASYILGQNAMGAVADIRMNGALDTIERYRHTINEVGERFHIPPELIGSIILKEQYTQSAPDEAILLARELGLYKAGTTGLGAISGPTAREALDYFDAVHEFEGRRIPPDNTGLLRLLAEDDEFNIAMIAAVAANEANNLGLGSGSALDKLSHRDWHPVLIEYNNTKYADKTIEYFPHIKTLLE
jgi:hypothetical protein